MGDPGGERRPEPATLAPPAGPGILQRVERLLGRSRLMGALFVASLALLLVPWRPASVAVPAVGAVATRDVLAPHDFRVTDVPATERARARRAEMVPMTFDFDSRLLGAASQQVERLFDAGRAAQRAVDAVRIARAHDVVPPGRADEADIGLVVLLGRPEVPTTVATDVLAALQRHGFDAAHEQSILRVLRAVLSKRIARMDDATLERYRGRPVTARDVATGDEVKVARIDEIFTPDQARRFLASELAQEADLWDRASRTALEPFLGSLLEENFTLNEALYRERQRLAMEGVPALSMEVKKGEKIVGRGERVDAEAHEKLLELSRAAGGGGNALQAAGIVVLLGIFAYGLFRYVDYHQQSEKRVTNLYAMVVLAFLVSALSVEMTLALARLLAEQMEMAPYNQVDAYLFLAPYAIGSLILTLLVDSEIAMVFAVSFSLIAGLISDPGGDYTAALYALLSGFGAIYFTGPYLRRTTVLKSGLAIGVTAAVAVVGVTLQLGTWREPRLLLFSVACALGSGMLAGIVVQALLPLFETLFGILTDLKLSELMSANHPLISELALRAPGTYNHSIIVGTLAEAAAKSVGVSPVFMRAAAYYHDIGKMKMPEYFIENQADGVNRHDRLAPSLSAFIVRRHVKDGIEMGRAHGLPEALIEMIPAHHGTRMLAYFFRKAKMLEDAERSTVNESDYRYPGPKPRNKEGGIMMLCDAVEAAARSLKDPTSQKFQNVIDKMTETIFLDGQLDETELTLKDLHAIKQAFHKVLISIYHHRIKYPGFDFDRSERKPTRTPRPVDGETAPA